MVSICLSFCVLYINSCVTGPVISSYPVQDRVQVPDFDPGVIVDDEPLDPLPCPLCGRRDNEDALLFCEQCNYPYHTYCVEYDGVPSAEWYCQECRTEETDFVDDTDQDFASSATSAILRRRRYFDRQAHAAPRRNRARRQINDAYMARVWRSVWDRLDFDLDFPFDDQEEAERLEQVERHGAAYRSFQAAGRQPNFVQMQGERSMATAPLGMRRGWPSRPRPRMETPEPESLDEIRAWNAFERARQTQDVPVSNRSRRRSPTDSPTEQTSQPERRLKRPRTQRPEALASRFEQGESSRRTTSNVAQIAPDNGASAPSFLHRLLTEVEANGEANGAPRLLPPGFVPRRASPRSSSPHSIQSSHDSPSRISSRSPIPPPTTPPSSASDVNGSPTRLSPIFSPESPDSSDTGHPRHEHRIPHVEPNSSSPSDPHYQSSSTRKRISKEAKFDLQKMVSASLKPHYHNKELSKQEYKAINSSISRMLYERVGETRQMNVLTRIRWRTVASEEVGKALASLKESRTRGSGDSNEAIS